MLKHPAARYGRRFVCPIFVIYIFLSDCISLKYTIEFTYYIPKGEIIINILFVCHGNICRSPMAEFIFKDIVRRNGLENKYHIESAAVSSKELGNPVYPPAKKRLASMGLDCSEKRARQITRADYDNFDYILAADNSNVRNMLRFWGGDPDGKIRLLLDFTSDSRDISDPWYTGDFDTAKDDIIQGYQAFLKALED